MNYETMDLVQKMEASRLRDDALIEQYHRARIISSELAGLQRYNPDNVNFMGIEYTQAQIRNHWKTRIIVPLGFEFTLNNIANFLKAQKRECLDQIRLLRDAETFGAPRFGGSHLVN